MIKPKTSAQMRKERQENEDTPISRLCKEAQLKMESVTIFENTDMHESGEMYHFQIKLFFIGKGRIDSFICQYSKGLAHCWCHGDPLDYGVVKKPIMPHIACVLDCLISESDCLNYGFEEWAECLGYDPDNIKAEKTYNICKSQTVKLTTFLGQELFDKMQELERL